MVGGKPGGRRRRGGLLMDWLMVLGFALLVPLSIAELLGVMK